MRPTTVLIAVVLLAASAPFAPAQIISPANTPSDLSRIAGWKGAAPRSDFAFTFAIISDRTGGHAPGRWLQAVQEINRLQPEFVLSVGDFLTTATTDDTHPAWQHEIPRIPQMWADVESEVRQIQAPFFYCPGNHDVGNDLLLAEYLRRHGRDGKSYYSFDYRDCHFVILDSMSALRSDDFAAEQVDWLGEDLSRAADAKHVFIFYHHPLWTNAKLWKPLREKIDPAKTTIINGHTHRLSYALDCDVPTYVLASSGTRVSDRGRAFGDANMFALVSVDMGKPTIALIPLAGVLAADYAAFATKAQRMIASASSGAVPMNGGKHTITISNPLDAPLSIAIAAPTRDWSVEPALAAIDIAPGQSADLSFQLKPLAPDAPGLKLPITYAFTDPAGVKFQTTETHTVSRFQTLDIPRASAITLDGNLADWRDAPAKPLHVNARRNILQERPANAWRGPEDGSYTLRAVHDADRLYLAVEVTDDHVIPGHGANADTLTILWDIRPPAEAEQKMDHRTGYATLYLPVADESPKVIFPAQPREPLANLKAASARTPDGYVFEVALPLADLGLPTPLPPNTPIRLEIQLADQDPDGTTLLNSAGAPAPTRSSTPYLRATLR